jgi:hypothetical protein
VERGTLDVVGDRAIASSMQAWLGLSGLAGIKKRAAA